MNQVTVAKVVGAVLAKKALNVANLIWWLVSGAVLVLTWLLSSQISSWFWLLLILIIPIMLITGIPLLMGNRVVKRISPIKPTKEVKNAVNNFTGSVIKVAALRGTSWPLFMAGIVKDVVVHKDVRSVQSLMETATELKNEYTTLASEIGKVTKA
jgi:hypothetical protein